MTIRHTPPLSRRARQHGAFAIMAVPLLFVMLGFSALAVDAGLIYNRIVDLHGVAKAAALAAARELDGTAAGVTAARNAASTAVANLRYHNFANGIPFGWNDSALSFGSTSARSGTWLSVTEVGGSNTQAAGLYFARVDTAGLAPGASTIETIFIRILSSALDTIRVSESAIAGRTSVRALPIAVCAMSTQAASARSASNAAGTVTLSELVQWGFRRGISYDLMKLNPNGTSPVRYAVNPVSEPGTNGASVSLPALAPFVCSGSMWVKRLTSNAIRVTELPSPHPLASLSAALNTRFDNYSGTSCNLSGAPPDINIKSYAYDQTGVVKWMSPEKGSPAVATTTDYGKSEPVIDLPTPPTSAGDYGPLWAFAKAVKAPSPITAAEPANGYATFSSTEWPILYKSGPTAVNYPSSPPVPYLGSTVISGYYESPRTDNKPKSVPYRRVLHIPLLSCSPTAPSGTNVEANVVAVGKFFMTVPATGDSLIGEFAGLLPPQSLPGHVELFP